MVQVHNFSYGLLNPGLAYLTSCLGCFLGLQCTARARAMQGAQRIRWLLLAAVSIGITGIWVMHFIAMLGFTIPGQAITYNVPAVARSSGSASRACTTWACGPCACPTRWGTARAC